MRIIFFSTQKYIREYFDKYNTYNYNYTYIEESLNPNTVYLAAGHDVVCVFVNDIVDKVVIESLAKFGVKLIALRCAGFNNVNLAVTKAHNIMVVNVPDYSPQAIAEHTVGLLLTLNRHIHKSYNKLREGNFLLDNLIGFNLYNKTVGVIGTGKIGACFAKIMLGFGCKVVSYDPIINQELIALGVSACELDQLLASCDIISLHCPLNNTTNGLINNKTLSLMKSGVFIINTSRGGLIDSMALKDNLKNGHIGYFTSDVYTHESEIFFHDHSQEVIQDDFILELMMYPNVLLTPHQGFFTREAVSAITKTTLGNIYNFSQNKPINQISF